MKGIIEKGISHIQREGQNYYEFIQRPAVQDYRKENGIKRLNVLDYFISDHKAEIAAAMKENGDSSNELWWSSNDLLISQGVKLKEFHILS